MKPLVYVAGPYSQPDPVLNTHRAVRVGMRIFDTGLAGVIIPHLSLAAHLIAPRPIGYWYDFDLLQLEHCDFLYRMVGSSTGADMEVQTATRLGIPVIYEEDDDLKNLIEVLP